MSSGNTIPMDMSPGKTGLYPGDSGKCCSEWYWLSRSDGPPPSPPFGNYYHKCGFRPVMGGEHVVGSLSTDVLEWESCQENQYYK
nr:hypothetical protein [Tanacetum cinerariifolium]